MAKGINQKSWLNIVIISVSGLILAFTLLGRFFESGEQASSKNNALQTQAFRLVGIDFGNIQLQKKLQSWRVTPAGAMEQQFVDELIKQWNVLLTSEMQVKQEHKLNQITSATTVLLYLEDDLSPLICKVVFTSESAFIEFIATGHRISVELALAKKLLPETILILENKSLKQNLNHNKSNLLEINFQSREKTNA